MLTLDETAWMVGGDRRQTEGILQAVAVGPAARLWLQEARCGRVVHIFPRACNIVSDAGEILSVVLAPLPRGPFTVQARSSGWPCQGFLAWVQDGDPVRVHGSFLFAGGLAIALASAADWCAQPDWVWVRSRLRSRLFADAETLAVLLRQGSSDSLAPVALHLGREGDPLLGRDIAGRFQRAACPLVMQMHRGLHYGLRSEVSAAAGGLGGLGPGLTPAGDDFLLGVLIGLRAAWPVSAGRRLAASILEPAVPRTTRLSAAWLSAAGRGETDETWHEFLVALPGDDKRALNTAGQRILARGHSSGADALAGFAVALNARRPGESA